MEMGEEELKGLGSATRWLRVTLQMLPGHARCRMLIPPCRAATQCRSVTYATRKHSVGRRTAVEPAANNASPSNASLRAWTCRCHVRGATCT